MNVEKRGGKNHMTYTVVLMSKSKIETFVGAWSSIDEVKTIVGKYRPKALIISIYKSELVYDLTAQPLLSRVIENCERKEPQETTT
jgi:hypothetical protein